MSNFQAFDELIAALQNAVLDSYELIQKQHLAVIDKYFNKDGTPIMMKMKIPISASDTNDIKFRDVEVPMFVLVPQGSLRMKRVKLAFSVKMVRLDDSNTDKNKLNGIIKHDVLNNKTERYEKNKFRKILTNIFSGSNDSNSVNVELEFVDENPPEGVMRINDMLIRLMP